MDGRRCPDNALGPWAQGRIGPQALTHPAQTGYTEVKTEREEIRMMQQARQAMYHNPTGSSLQRQLALYDQALARGRRGQLWASLTHRSRGLLPLTEISRACTVQARNSGGTRMVALAQICGSENRAADFDRDFNPLQDHTRDRWLGIASALQRGRTLPPVALIQAGDRYFVRDGHHRISVARVLGQEAIEATVEVWQVDKPLPWEQLSRAPNRRRARNREELRTLASGPRPAAVLEWLLSIRRRLWV